MRWCHPSSCTFPFLSLHLITEDSYLLISVSTFWVLLVQCFMKAEFLKADSWPTAGEGVSVYLEIRHPILFYHPCSWTRKDPPTLMPRGKTSIWPSVFHGHRLERQGIHRNQTESDVQAGRQLEFRRTGGESQDDTCDNSNKSVRHLRINPNSGSLICFVFCYSIFTSKKDG